MLAFVFLGLTGFWAYVAYIGVFIGLSYLGGLLLAPDAPDAGEVEGGQSRKWDPRTIQQEGPARPRSYGKNLHHGNIVAKWTDVDGDEREILYLIIEHGDGPTKGIVSPIADNVFLNKQPATSFGSVTLQERLGTMNQTCMTGFEKPKLEYKQDAELRYGEDAITFTTPNDFFEDIEYTICFPNGLIKYHKDGDATHYGVHLRIKIKEYPAGSWVTLFDGYISAEQRKPLFKKYVVNTQVPGTVVRGKQYILQYERLTGADDERRSSNSFLRSVREVIDTAFTRPGKALVGIRAVATAQLSGNLDVKVIREDRIVNTWNGTSWELKYSNNRSDVAWDVATLPAIDGDGTPEHPYEIIRYDGWDPAHLNLDFFYKWRQFCAEEIADGYGDVEARCACNTIIDEFTDIYSLVCKLGSVGRATIYWNGHQLTGWIDDEVTTPIDLVTMDSMMHKTWKNAWAVPDELMGVAEILYRDEKLGFERTSAEWASEDAGGFRNIVSFEGLGIITRGAAIHYANYLLERNHLIRNRNRFKVAKDGFRYTLGNVINLQCRIANWGAAFRVKSATADTIIVNRNVESEVDVGDVIHIRTYSAVLKRVVAEATYFVDAVAGKVITATTNWGTLPVKGNLVAVGPAGAIKERRIIKMAPTTDNYFNVEVETYDETLFDADTLDPDNPYANYVWPGPVTDATPPVTKEELQDMIINSLPPQPDIEIPWPSNLKWNDNTPIPGCISWSKRDDVEDITIRFQGTTYPISVGSTAEEFVYWDPAIATTTFQTTNLVTTATGAGRWVMCRNINGVAYPVNSMIMANIGILLAGYLRVGTADIVNLAVQTLHIQDNAVTLPASAFTTGPISFGAETTIQQLAFETTGQPLYIQFSGGFTSSSALTVRYLTLRIYRGTTKVYENSLPVPSLGGAFSLANIYSFNFSESPGTGTYTYYIKAVTNIPGAQAKNRSLYIHELKK